MSVLNPKQLNAHASQAMNEAPYPPKRLALIYAAVTVAVLLAGVLASYGLTALSANTGGLSGMGARAILSTAESSISLLSTVFLSFWELGFVYACIRICRRETADLHTLSQGLRRFAPMLRLYILQVLIYSAIGFFAIQVASTIFLLLPGSAEVLTMFESVATAETLDDATVFAMFRAAMPLYAIAGVLCLALIIPVSYRLRLAMYLVLDGKTDRAMQAIAQSMAMMRRNCFGMFRLDLRFWWYYGLSVVLAVVSSADMLLQLVNISLPLGETGTALLFYGIYLAGMFLLSWGAAAKVQTTYAAAYDALLKQAEEAAKAAEEQLPTPENNGQLTIEN